MGTGIGIGPNGQERLLWDNASGQISVWNLADANPAATCLLYGPFSGWTAKSVTVGPDNAGHLLWDNADGRIALWNLTDSSPSSTCLIAGGFSGWSGLSLGFSPSNYASLLWSQVSGLASIWNITSPSSYTTTLLPTTTVGGTGATFGYTSDGLRAWKQTGAGVRTYYLYDGSAPVCELDASGAVTAVNTFGAQGLVSRHVTASNTSTFYTFDERGNVAQRTSSTGPVLSTDLDDAYGTLLAGGAAGDPWGFEAQSGYYTDTETGLILCTHRYYDPNKGRFLTRDPIGYAGGIDLYGYTADNPVNEEDPDGTRKYKIHNPSHTNQPQNVGDALFGFTPANIYDHRNYMIDIPDSQHLDRNIAYAVKINSMLQGSGMNPVDIFSYKKDYLSHFCANGTVGDYGKNLGLYPDSDPSKNYYLHWQRRLGGNFNFGAMGAGLGFDLKTLLVIGHYKSVTGNGHSLHFQIEQDAIEDGYWYFYSTHPK